MRTQKPETSVQFLVLASLESGKKLAMGHFNAGQILHALDKQTGLGKGRYDKLPVVFVASRDPSR